MWKTKNLEKNSSIILWGWGGLRGAEVVKLKRCSLVCFDNLVGIGTSGRIQRGEEG